MKRSLKWCLLILLSLIMAVSAYAKEDTAISRASDTEYSALILVKKGDALDYEMLNSSSLRFLKNKEPQDANRAIGITIPKGAGTDLSEDYLKELCEANSNADPGNYIHAKRLDGSGCDLYFTDFIEIHEFGSDECINIKPQ